MPKDASTITLDQADPKVGDTVTFTVGDAPHKATVTINVFDNGIVQAERKPVGEPFTLTHAGSVMVYLMAGDKIIAQTSFYAT